MNVVSEGGANQHVPVCRRVNFLYPLLFLVIIYILVTVGIGSCWMKYGAQFEIMPG